MYIDRTAKAVIFLSTLSLRRATVGRAKGGWLSHGFLSTLSLRRATISDIFRKSKTEFLSTLSLRRATYHRILLRHSVSYFYPRSPCGERPVTSVARVATTVISIHALLAESDHSLNLPSRPIDKFLSTLSLRRATAAGRLLLS